MASPPSSHPPLLSRLRLMNLYRICTCRSYLWTIKRLVCSDILWNQTTFNANYYAHLHIHPSHSNLFFCPAVTALYDRTVTQGVGDLKIRARAWQRRLIRKRSRVSGSMASHPTSHTSHLFPSRCRSAWLKRVLFGSGRCWVLIPIQAPLSSKYEILTHHIIFYIYFFKTHSSQWKSEADLKRAALVVINDIERLNFFFFFFLLRA